MKKFAYLLFLIFASSSFAQHSGTLQWKYHPSLFEGVDVAPLKNKVYAGMSNALVEYDTDESSYEVYDITNYLSDIDISCVKSDGNNNLLIGYSNGNLDLLTNNTFYNLPEILNGNQNGVKTIFDIHFDGNKAYIATGIGVVVYNLPAREVESFFNPSENNFTLDVTTIEDTLFVATEQGIYKINKNHPFLADQTQWEKLNVFGLLNDARFSSIESFNNDLYALYDNPVYGKDSLILVEDTPVGIEASFLHNAKFSSYNDRLLLNSEGVIYRVNGTSVSNELYQYVNNLPHQILNACYVNGWYWIADANYGLVRALNTWSNTPVPFNSPHRSSAYGMEISGDRVIVAGGGLFGYEGNTFNKSGFYVNKSGTWSNFNRQNNSANLNEFSYDFVGGAINPNNSNDYYVYGNSGTSIVELNDNTIEAVYTPLNSTLDGTTNDNDVRIGGVVVDDEGDMWAINSFSQNPLKLKTSDGLWYQTSVSSSIDGNEFFDLHYDYNKNLWICSDGAGLAVYDFGRNKTDFSDDQKRVFNSSNASLPSNIVYSAIMDFDGEIWIGTKSGLAIIYNGNDIFNEEIDIQASQIIVQRNGEVDVLLGKNSIVDIELDGANRKWIAIEQAGVVCLSPDGTEEIYNFNEENSELISNNVFDIEIDHTTGEVYFATDKGLISFRSDATNQESKMENVKVFPNPVQPNYTGVVTVSGLAYNADVDITDVSGNVVFQTSTNGGTVTWDCKTVNGERVTTGVYLFWVAQNEGKNRKVAKVMVIN